MADRSLEIRYLNVDVSAGESNILVVGVPEYTIVLLSYALVAAGAVITTFEDSDGTNRIGPMALGANAIATASENRIGWTRTGSGLGLNLLLGGAVQVGGSITYRLVPDHFEF